MMGEKKPQTFANHSRLIPMYHFVLFSVILLNIGAAGWVLYKDPSVTTAIQLVFAISMILLFLFVRLKPLTVQDRVIRLEMRLRLAEVLPADLRGRIDELTRSQFVALRFAPDAELPELVKRVLAGELKTGNEIKAAIRTWNPDYFRC
jgi:Family of unknown function (DUF6526)